MAPLKALLAWVRAHPGAIPLLYTTNEIGIEEPEHNWAEESRSIAHDDDGALAAYHAERAQELFDDSSVPDEIDLPDELRSFGKKAGESGLCICLQVPLVDPRTGLCAECLASMR